ncbi:MAG: hypothetical protein HY362_04135 [Candidatus Aenigmarchaeota archaeon]|nr:hypothetical protein [Candidatus Aenigmarchaeota archaeon]
MPESAVSARLMSLSTGLKTRVPSSSPINKTYFGRYPLLYAPLRRYIAALPQDPNVLLVGVGADSRDAGYSISEPFEVAGALEGLSKDYRMVVLDINPHNLRALERKHSVTNTHPTQESIGIWNQYLDDTGQQKKPASTKAKIPESFRRKLREGEVKLVRGNIATKGLSKYGQFDLCICLNVLTHFFNHDKELADGNVVAALSNMAKNTTSRGIVVVDDNINDYAFYVPPFLSEEKAAELTWDTFVREKIEGSPAIGLVVEEDIRATSQYSHIFARKVASAET